MECRYETLKPGCAVRVHFGSSGSQIAVVHDRTPAGNVRAYKYSAKTRCWKGPIRIRPADIMPGLVNRTELERLPAVPTA